MFSVSVLDALDKLGKRIHRKNQERENKLALQEALNDYPDKFSGTYGSIKIFPGMMSAPKDLTEVYTEVRISKEWFPYLIPDVENFDKDISRSGSPRGYKGKNSENPRGIEWIFNAWSNHEKRSIHSNNSYPIIAVLGEPGSGKTTFLKRIGMEILKEPEKGLNKIQVIIPVFLELKSLNHIDHKKIGMLDMIASELNRLKIPFERDFSEDFLESGNFLILLDGLDEVLKSKRGDLIHEINEFSKKYSNNRVVVSCRGSAYHSSFLNAEEIMITEFKEYQVESFVKKWFGGKLDKSAKVSEQFIKKINYPLNDSIRELSKTPLLLVFLCLIYDKEQNFPRLKSSIYSKSLDIILSGWASQKRLEPEIIFKRIGTDLEKKLLSELAYRYFENGKITFHRQDFINEIDRTKGKFLDEQEDLKGEEIITVMEEVQGIIVRQSLDRYSFSHMVFHEYLTARYILQKTFRDFNFSRNVFENYYEEPRWRNVFKILVGMPDEADPLFFLMVENINKYKKNRIIESINNWIDSQTSNRGKAQFSPLSRRIVAFSLIFSIVCSSILLENLAQERARSLDDGGYREASDISDLKQSLSYFRVLAYSDYPLDNHMNRSRQLTSIIRYSIIFAKSVENHRSYRQACIPLMNLYKILGDQRILNELNDNSTITSLEKLSKELSKNSNNMDKTQSLIVDLKYMWCQALNIPIRDFEHMPLLDISALSHYTNANLMLLDCRRSASLTKEGWKEIQTSLLSGNL